MTAGFPLSALARRGRFICEPNGWGGFRVIDTKQTRPISRALASFPKGQTMDAALFAAKQERHARGYEWTKIVEDK